MLHDQDGTGFFYSLSTLSAQDQAELDWTLLRCGLHVLMYLFFMYSFCEFAKKKEFTQVPMSQGKNASC